MSLRQRGLVLCVHEIDPAHRQTEPLPRAVHVVFGIRDHAGQEENSGLVRVRREPAVRSFAGIWTNWTFVRKAKESEVTCDLYAFLTTDANADVGQIHPKAMPGKF